MSWNRKRLLKIPLAIAIIAVVTAIARALWNELIPELFHGPVLSYWQTLGLFVLSKLFLGIGPHGGRHGHLRHLRKLPPEERERLKEALRAYHG